MVRRLRTALIENYVGAILAAWLFVDGVEHAVGVIVSPLASWEAAKFARSVTGNSNPFIPLRERFPWGMALPDLVWAVLLLPIAYGILRWLYFERPNPQESLPAGD